MLDTLFTNAQIITHTGRFQGCLGVQDGKIACLAEKPDGLEAREVIQRCNPHPGAAYANDAADIVVPEIVVIKKDGIWHAELNADAMPKIRINRMYGEILKNTSN